MLKVEGEGDAPLLNIFGGKLTTHRRLSEQAVDKIGTLIGAKGARWTRTGHLPGGAFPTMGFEALVKQHQSNYPRFDALMVRRMTRAYGTLMPAVVAGATSVEELGEHFGAGLHAREVDYLISREWARTAEDVLWRRSKLGLRVSAEDTAKLTRYMEEKTRGVAVA